MTLKILYFAGNIITNWPLVFNFAGLIIAYLLADIKRSLL